MDGSGRCGYCPVTSSFLLNNLAHEQRDIEDQCNRSVTQNGRTTDSLQGAEHLAERFDNGLEFSFQFVNDQTCFVTCATHDNDILPARATFFDVELLA